MPSPASLHERRQRPHARPGRGCAPAQGAVDAGGSAEHQGAPESELAHARGGTRALVKDGPRAAAPAAYADDRATCSSGASLSSQRARRAHWTMT
eukprot:scaffold138440_cov124-Phaeocystis_antarctica.AAC.1